MVEQRQPQIHINNVYVDERRQVHVARACYTMRHTLQATRALRAPVLRLRVHISVAHWKE